MAQQADQIVDTGHRRAIGAHDDVIGHQPSGRGRPVRLERGDHRARGVVDAGKPGVAARYRRGLRGDADEAAPHTAVQDQLAEHELRGVARDREADALRAADDRGIDTDHLAARIDQRPAGIAGIERRVGLDHILDQPAVAGPQRAAERRDDARRHRRFKTERIADRDDELPALERFGIADRRDGEIARGAGPQQSEVGIRVLAQHPRFHHAAFGIGQAEVVGTMHHMAVGQDETIRRNDHAGADAGRPRRAALLRLEHLDAHHRRPGALGGGDHGVGIGIVEHIIRDTVRQRSRALGLAFRKGIEHRKLGGSVEKVP